MRGERKPSLRPAESSTPVAVAVGTNLLLPRTWRDAPGILGPLSRGEPTKLNLMALYGSFADLNELSTC